MLNDTINFVTKLRFMVWFNMETIPKSDIKFDISIKLTTWIGHYGASKQVYESCVRISVRELK